MWYGYFNWPDGGKWIARLGKNYYRIIHDGTGNQFYHSHAPQLISEEEAKYTLWKSGLYEKGMEVFGWPPLTDEEEDKFIRRSSW